MCGVGSEGRPGGVGEIWTFIEDNRLICKNNSPDYWMLTSGLTRNRGVDFKIKEVLKRIDVTNFFLQAIETWQVRPD
jgi:hypothetical protein